MHWDARKKEQKFKEMLFFSFCLAAVALFFQGLLFPSFGLLAFAPWLAILQLRSSLPKALWLSAFAGALLDLLCEDPMGIHALNYTLVTFILYPQRRHLSWENPFHVSLLTGFISALSTLFGLVLLFLFDRRAPFDGKWIWIDLIGMPIADAIYALIWFSAPLVLFEKLHRLWMVFWLKRKNLSPSSH